MKQVIIFTDGSCIGNPGPGGYGVILKHRDRDDELKGGELHTTNNRMEMMACIVALESLTEQHMVSLTTDSKYVKDGIEKWIKNWKKNDWRTKAGQPVKNKDLWVRLDAQVQRHTIKWSWVKGHSGHPDNERADQLAKSGVPK